MPLLARIQQGSATLGIWNVEETAQELRKLLSSPLSYDAELSRYKLPKRKIEYLAARVLLKSLLGEEIFVHYTATGKPYIQERGFLSISHSGAYVAVIIHPSAAVGIDIESYSDKVDTLFPKFMSTEECKPIADYPLIEKRWHYLLHWSSKETLYKLLSTQGIDFRKDFFIPPFERKESGSFSFVYTRTEEHYEVQYLCHKDFVCTWCIASL